MHKIQPEAQEMSFEPIILDALRTLDNTQPMITNARLEPMALVS